MEKILFLFFCTIFAVKLVFSQKIVKFNPFLHRYTLKNAISAPKIPQIRSVVYVSPDFYSIQSGFFCKKEREFEKATKIALKFRLGNLSDCNRLEGKSGY